MLEKLSPKSQSAWETVKKSAKWREGVTKRYAQGLESVTINKFMDSLSKPPFDIKNITSVTDGVYKLQRHFKFKDEVSPAGCDGILGRRTYGRYKIALEAHQKQSKLKAQIKPPVKPVAPTKQANILPKPKKVEQVPSDPNKLVTQCHLNRKYQPSEIYACGDSLMIYYSYLLARQRGKPSKFFTADRSIKGARRTVKYTDSVRRHWKSNEEMAMRTLNKPSCKCLVYNGGYNDLTSAIRGVCKSSKKTQEIVLTKIVDRIVASHKRVIAKAHSKGKEVILFTLHDRKPGQVFKGWMKNPVAHRLIKEGTRRINERIRTSGADMIVETDQLPKSDFGKDKLHWGMRGARRIKDAITKNAVA